MDAIQLIDAEIEKLAGVEETLKKLRAQRKLLVDADKEPSPAKIADRAVKAADKIGNDQLRIGINRGPGPSIAGIGRIGLRPSDVLFRSEGEAPDCIDLNPRSFCVTHGRLVIGHARFARVDKKLENRVFTHAG